MEHKGSHHVPDDDTYDDGKEDVSTTGYREKQGSKSHEEIRSGDASTMPRVAHTEKMDAKATTTELADHNYEQKQQAKLPIPKAGFEERKAIDSTANHHQSPFQSLSVAYDTRGSPNNLQFQGAVDMNSRSRRPNSHTKNAEAITVDEVDDDDVLPGAIAIPGIAYRGSEDDGDLEVEYNNSENRPADPVVMAENVDENALAERLNVPTRDEIRDRILKAEATSAMNVKVEHGEKTNNRMQLWKKANIVIAVLTVVVVVIVVVVVMSSKKKQQGNVNSETSENQHYDADKIYLQNLLGPISGKDAIMDDSTYQYQALEWVLTSYVDGNDELTNDLAEGNNDRLVERYVLALMFFSMGGDTWINNDNFLAKNKSVCEWQFIKCNVQASMISIEIKANNVTGSIPHELGSISSLERLDLPINEITGIIPDSIGYLPRLSFLQLSLNDLTGTIPQSLENLSQLEVLVLHVNQLTGTIPSRLTSLARLKTLYLGHNKLTGTIPSFELPESSSGQSTRDLSEVSLHYNRLTGQIPKSLYSLSNLDFLLLHGNGLTGTVHFSIGQLSKLEVLAIHTNNLSGTIPTTIGQLEFLELWEFFDNSFTGTIPTEVGRLYSLQSALLGINELTGSLPSEFSQLPSLLRLEVNANLLTGTVPSSLGQATSLEQFKISATSISGSLDSLFCAPNRTHSVYEIQADCGGDAPEISCPCCTECCADHLAFCQKNTSQVCQNVGTDIGGWVPVSRPVCNCEVGSYDMICNFQDDCVTCNEEGTVCGTSKDYGYTLSYFGNIFDKWTGSFQYQTGRSELVTLEYAFKPSICTVSIDGEQCVTCVVATCKDGFDAIVIDCSNIPTEGASPGGGPAYHSCFPGDVENLGPLEIFWWMDSGDFTGCPVMMVTHSYSPKDLIN